MKLFAALLLVSALALAHAAPVAPSPTPPAHARKYTVAVDWAAPPAATASTAATIEVDCCEPFVTRDPAAHLNGGGPFGSYTTAMQDLGAEFVRWAPWYVYPRVVVMELEPPDCTATQPATNWDSEHFDAVTADFMEAVCGPQAALGKCEHSVAIQIATSPSWVWNNGTDPKTLPENPWEYESGKMEAYNKGTTLVDETCKPLAEYVGRVVAHYTAGGHNDSCGHWHPSGLHYNWSIVSFYNENEHQMGGPRYTRCWDQLRPLIDKISPGTVLEGPETVSYTQEVGAGYSNDYLSYFIDPKNHADQRAPELLSFHWDAGNVGMPEQYNAAISAVDTIVDGHVKPLVALRDKVAPKTEMALNEYIFFVADWCDPDDAKRLFAEFDDLEADPQSQPQQQAGLAAASGGGSCPNWADSRANGSAVGVNRRTLGWSASAAHFAYGYARLALQGFKYVGLDDLACGPWPDNEPAVTGMDWQTGEPMARFFVVRMLAKEMGIGLKSLFNATVTFGGGAAPPPPPPAGGGCFMSPKGAVNYKYAPGNVFPTDAQHPHGLRLKNSAAECCSLCQSLKNCSFFTYSAGGVPTKPTCYNKAGGCCFLKTAEGGINGQAGCTQCMSGSTKPLPAAPATVTLFAMPYIVHDSGKRGVLLINKVSTPLTVTLHGAGVSGVNTTAQVLDGTVDGKSVDPEPGYVQPVDRVIGADGVLALGPYAIALVHAGKQ